MSAIAEAFEVLITTFHETVIDILYPILTGEDEAEADGDEHQGGDGFAKQHVEQGVEAEGHAKGGKGDEVLHAGTHVLAIGHLDVEANGVGVVNGHLEQAEIDETDDEDGP